jgi:2-polyprenyl-6-hydroxyphenyl methylase/3-demethylubiquinone-9 3-methyltransferase
MMNLVPTKNIEACKCCGQAAPLFCVVDFTRNAGHRFPLSGVPVYYHRCQHCGFLFTTALDQFTPEDFSNFVYNSDYRLVDPDYAGIRATHHASMLTRLFPTLRPASVLDYGCGNGGLVQRLSAAFAPADGYDPFVAEFSGRPTKLYDCVTSFEVAEHSNTPVDVFVDMASFLNDSGTILFSTLVQPGNIDQQGANWWYIGPRAGHISLHSAASLRSIAAVIGMTLLSLDDSKHIMYRGRPDWISALI